MIGRILAGRYAEALIDISLEEKTADQTKNELARFADIVEGSDLKDLFANQSFSLDEKLGILKDITSKLKLSRILVNFLSLLMENKRIDLLKDINGAFQDILDEKMGRVRAEVTLPMKLQKSEVESIRTGLEATTGKKVVVDVLIDPDIIGGVVAKVGSTIYDGSLKAQLNNLKKSIIRG